MRKPRIIAILITFGILGMVSGLVAKAPPKKVVIKSCQKKRPPVAFDHEKHSKKLKIECKACHHAVKAKDKYQKCITCHAGKKKGKKPGCSEMSMKKNPYHLNCAGCHKDKNKGPKTCKGCHKK